MKAMENYFRLKLNVMAIIYVGLIAVAVYARQA